MGSRWQAYRPLVVVVPLVLALVLAGCLAAVLGIRVLAVMIVHLISYQ